LDQRALRAANLAAKGALAAVLLYGVVRSDLPQFAGKSPGGRLAVYGVALLLVPAVWRGLGDRVAGRPYPYAIDLCVVAPFLLDSTGNALNLFDTVSWFDELTHLVNWIPWVTAFGLALHYAPPLPRWAHFGLVLGFGAVTHILWELGEYVAFIHDSPELDTAYTDTLGDLALSLTGSLIGATLVVTVLWDRTVAARS
jgi:hypothetical protein